MDRPLPLTHPATTSDPPGESSEVTLADNAANVVGRSIANPRVETQLDNVKETRRPPRAPLFPICELPTDLLGEVFGCVVGNRRPYIHGMDQVVILCRVCKAWRDAAYATHRLWASFEFTLSANSWYNRRSWYRAERWMRLSGALPKNISVNAEEDMCDSSRTEQGKPVCMLSDPKLIKLLKEGPDIQALSITCASSRCMHNLCQAVQSAAPRDSLLCPWDRVGSLSIHVWASWTEMPSPDYLIQGPVATPIGGLASNGTSFLQHLPPVKSIHLSTPSQRNNPSFIAIPRAFLSNLTTLSLDNNWNGYAVAMVLGLCHESINLRELVLDRTLRWAGRLTARNDREAEWAAEILEKGKLFVFPNLQTLRFWHLHPDEFKITRFFKAPTLVELELDFEHVENGYTPPWCPPGEIYIARSYDLIMDLPRFIERSACHSTLRRLAFRGYLRLEMEDLKQWLKETILPALSHLTFDGVYLPQELFYCLRHRNRSDGLPLTRTVKTVELLNLPTETHASGILLREYRQNMQPGDPTYPLPGTNIILTVKERPISPWDDFFDPRDLDVVDGIRPGSPSGSEISL